MPKDKKPEPKAATPNSEPKVNIIEHIQAIRAKFDTERDEEIQKLISTATTEFDSLVHQLEAKYDELPDDVWRSLKWPDNRVMSLTKVRDGMIRFLQKRKGKRSSAKGIGSTRAPRAPKVSDEDIIKFLATEQTSKQVETALKLSVNTGKRLKALLAAKKVTVRQEGTSKHWKAV